METDYKKASRISWQGSGSTGALFPGVDYVNMASLQRIADATEAMAKNHIRLQEDLEWMTKSRDRWQNDCESLARKNANLRGQMTKLKKLLTPQP